MTGISVIIPTINRSSYLVRTLKDLINQRCSFSFEIIVVDQSEIEDAEVHKLIKDVPHLNYHHIRSFKGLPEARNYGAKNARYDLLVFVDDDISCKENFLSSHYNAITHQGCSMIAGGINEHYNPNNGNKPGYFHKLTATPIAGFHLNGIRKVDHVKGCNYSILKDVYFENTGTDELLTKGAALYEELDLCLRVSKAGHEIWFDSEAHVVHYAAPTGGCRIENITAYVESLSRNRSIIIRRHLQWYYQITAHIYLLRLIGSYLFSYRNLGVFMSYIRGLKEGTKAAINEPVNSFKDAGE